TPVAARKLEVIRTDTLRATRRSSLVDRIDSLIRLQDSTAIGSPEYVRINRELNATIHAMLPPGLISGDSGTLRIMLAPEAPGQPRFTVARKAPNVEPRGWLGIHTDGVYSEWVEPNGHYYQYFVYPLVVSVDPNSPAAKAGVQFGDSLLAYNGTDLRGHVFNFTKLIVPGQTLKMTLRRDGDTKDISLVP